MKHFVVILHFGNIQMTKKSIASLFGTENFPFQLIIVNNDSSSYKSTRFTNRKCVVINNEKNLGFAGGVNVGIRYAIRHGGDTICILNNDTKIVQPFLERISYPLRSKHIGISAPAIQFNKNGKKIFDLGGKINSLILRTSHEEVTRIISNVEKEVDYVSGCCMLIRKDVFKKIGYFDESFFLYYEDADFCIRARNAGYKIENIPSVFIQHDLSHSAGRMTTLAIYHLLRSRIIFGKKYAKGMLRILLNKIFVLIQAMLFLKANPQSATAIARALLSV